MVIPPRTLFVSLPIVLINVHASIATTCDVLTSMVQAISWVIHPALDAWTSIIIAHDLNSSMAPSRRFIFIIISRSKCSRSFACTRYAHDPHISPHPLWLCTPYRCLFCSPGLTCMLSCTSRMSGRCTSIFGRNCMIDECVLRGTSRNEANA